MTLLIVGQIAGPGTEGFEFKTRTRSFLFALWEKLGSIIKLCLCCTMRGGTRVLQAAEAGKDRCFVLEPFSPKEPRVPAWRLAILFIRSPALPANHSVGWWYPPADLLHQCQ